MTDPIRELAAALGRATPEPSAVRKAEAVARAMAEFDRRQGTDPAPRPMTDRPDGWARFGQGARKMLDNLTSRGGLAASTAIVAVGLAVLLPVLRDAQLPAVVTMETETAPGRAPASVAIAPAREAAKADDEAGRTSLRQDRIAAEAPQGTQNDAPPVADTLAATVTESYAAPPPAAPSAGLAERGRMAGDLSPTVEAVPVAREVDSEAYANAGENPLKVTAEEPVSTFSVDVDTASYALARSSLMRGELPPPESVRPEEFVNYFPYAYPAPDADGPPFRPTVSVIPTPWNPGTRLVEIGLQGRVPAVSDRPPLNLVFLIDTSGSMEDPAKLPLLVQSFRLMLSELRPEDEVAIVAYAGSAGEVLAPTPASDRETILAALTRLQAGGSTAGQEGLALAYDVAGRMAGEGEVSRVILATDGDFNVGIADPAALKDYVGRERDRGIYLSVLGFGRGNLDDATMQALAQNGNGTAAYIDTLNEARKVLVDQLTGALYPIADDVKVQVEWNPATVAEYRLIGYETRALRREDFRNDRVDAGEIGAGHAVTALYEVTPVGSDARLTEALRYGVEPEIRGAADELGWLRLRYKEPGQGTSALLEQPIPTASGEGSADARFAAAVAGFAQLLRGSDRMGDWGFADAAALAEGAIGPDPFGYRHEAVSLMRLADSLSR